MVALTCLPYTHGYELHRNSESTFSCANVPCETGSECSESFISDFNN